MRQGTAIGARRVTGQTDHSIADFTINTYHFGLNYFINDPEAKVRPYVRVSLGWTGSRLEVNGVDTYNRFSGCWTTSENHYLHQADVSVMFSFRSELKGNCQPRVGGQDQTRECIRPADADGLLWPTGIVDNQRSHLAPSRCPWLHTARHYFLNS
jgi:hypothetical protein